MKDKAGNKLTQGDYVAYSYAEGRNRKPMIGMGRVVKETPSGLITLFIHKDKHQAIDPEKILLFKDRTETEDYKKALRHIIKIYIEAERATFGADPAYRIGYDTAATMAGDIAGMVLEKYGGVHNLSWPSHNE